MEPAPDKFSAFKAQALADCLEQIAAGARPEEVVKSYGELAPELLSLIEAASASRTYAASLTPNKAALARSRAKFLNAAQAQSERSKKGWLAVHFSQPLAFAALAFLLVLLIGGFSTVAASAQALPGDWLYSVKIAAEQTRLRLTSDPLQRLKLEQTFDQRRAEEIQRLQKANRSETIRLAGEVRSIQADVWDVRGIQVLISADTRLEHEIEVGFYVEVTGRLLPDGRVLADAVRARLIEFNGVVESMTAQSWVIDGLTVKVTGNTVWIGNPSLNSAVKVGAFVLADGSLQAYRIQAAGVGEPAATWTRTPTASPTLTATPTQTAPAATLSPAPTQTPELKETEKPESDETPDQDDNKDDDNENDNENKDSGDDQSDDKDSSGKSPTETPKPDETEKPDDDSSKDD